jgi:hypothetical protein
MDSKNRMDPQALRDRLFWKEVIVDASGRLIWKAMGESVMCPFKLMDCEITCEEMRHLEKGELRCARVCGDEAMAFLVDAVKA